MHSLSRRLGQTFLSVFLFGIGHQVGGQEIWTPAASATSQNLWSVAQGGGQFVAVGEGSAVVSSPDGISWIARPVFPSGYWLVAVGYGGGTWVVVGDKGLILTSTNLTAWNVRESGTTSRINGVTFGGGRWIAVAESGELLTSVDAANWFKLKPSSDRLHGIVHAYGQFVITGDNGLVRSTIDATDYVERILPGSMFLEAVTYARRGFMAIGEAGFAVRASDGVNWESVNTGSASHFRGLAFFNNQFIAAGTDGTILTTPDANSPWLKRNSNTSVLLTSVTANESAAVVVGFGGTVLRSAPTPSAPSIAAAPRAVTEAFGSNVLFDVTASGSLPLSYQWFFNGQPIASATTDRLFLANVQAAQAGSYSLRVSNIHGSVLTPGANLRLIETTEPRSIVDSSFAPRLSMPNGVAAVVEQADGKVVIGGAQFFVTAGVSPFALARLNRDGSIDSTFAIGSGLNSGGTVSQLVLQPDGKILVAGSFQSINGVSRPSLARLNSDGSVDTGFTASPSRANSAPAKLALLSDGKLLAIVGSTLLRLHSDGREDATFSPVQANDFGVFDKGGIAVIGADGILRRISVDGTADSMPIQYSVPGYSNTSFSAPNQIKPPDRLVSSADGRVYGISSYPLTIGDRGTHYAIVELDGGATPFFRLFYSGMTNAASFTYLPIKSGSVFVALTSRSSNGVRFEDRSATIHKYTFASALDTSFDSRGGADKQVFGLFPLRDGGVLATGTFTTFDGIARPTLVRLVGTNALEAVPPTLVSATPEAAAVLPGTAVPLAFTAAGTAPLTYKWSIRHRDSEVALPVTEAAAPSLRFVPMTPGVYTATVTVTNRAGTTTSAPIRVAVADSAPVIVSLPTTVTALSGRSATLAVSAAGTQPLTYQWLRNGTPVGSGSALAFSRASSASQGDYTVVITNSLGRTSSLPVRLTVDSMARLSNISTRTAISPGQPLIAGFVITGDTSQRVLVRGIGPGLAAFGITGVLPDPTLSLVDSTARVVASNNNWDPLQTPGGLVEGVGAFRLTSASDAALVATLAPGAYTVQLTDTASRSGVGLLEVYRADDAVSRLVNLSSRGFVGAGSSLAIAGIAVEGEQPRQFLIRGVGPALLSFGVSDAIADPAINLTSATGESLFRNDDWGLAVNAVELAATAVRLGAFPLPAGTKDAALLVTLAPGNYTALVSGSGESTGTALIEVYEVP
jgi:uncharacterized delta-60 repeat protein